MKYLLLIGGLVFTAYTAVYAAETAGAPTAFAGKVLATTNAAGYTYLQVDTGKEKLWAAAPQFQVKPGDQVAIADAMPMPNYHSKTLNRDFEVVYFSGGVQVNGAAPAGSSGSGGAMELPKGHPPIQSGPGSMELPKNHPPLQGSGAAPAPQMDYSKLKKAPGGQTVQAIVQNKAKLAGKEVKVRAKVVKSNANILGKNWLHLRDGTGSEGSNDLLATTSDAAKVGDTVLVTGKVATDKDFGMNYKYPVMIEDAQVTVE